MKVLSLLQPWATLVIIGAKKIETRSWSTGHRGDLLIHASRGKAGQLIAEEVPFTKYIRDFNSLTFGAIIGCVKLEEVLPLSSISYDPDILNQMTLEERAFGDYGSERFGWILSDPISFKNPIPARGHLHLWNYEKSTDDHSL